LTFSSCQDDIDERNGRVRSQAVWREGRITVVGLIVAVPGEICKVEAEDWRDIWRDNFF
jgi:hypothetical protein